MGDFVAALGLFLVLEGLIYGGFPALARRMAADIAAASEQVLRVAGVVAMLIGVILVWLVRG